MLEEGERGRARERDKRDHQCSKSHRHGEQIETYEASLFLFLVGDVERGDHRCGAVGAAVGCDQERKDDPQSLGFLRTPCTAFISWSPMRKATSAGRTAVSARMCSTTVKGSATKPVNEDDQPEQRKQRKEAVESDPRGDQPDIVVPHALVGALGDVLPCRLRGICARRIRLMSPVRDRSCARAKL